MRKSLLLLFVLVFFPLLVGFDWTESDPGPLWNTETVRLQFEDAYTPAGRTLITIETEIYNSVEVLVQHVEVHDEEGIEPVDGKFQIPVYQYVEALPDGIYHSRLRVVDLDGNVSGWAPFIYFRKAWLPLPPPGGCVLVR